MIKQDMTISDYVVEESSSNVPVNEGVSTNSSDSSSSSSDSDSSDAEDDGTYTPSIAGKLLYWLDMSQKEDYVFNGDFIDVTFRVKDDAPDGNYTIGIGECDFANYDAETVTYTTVDGDIAVGSAEKLETGTPSGDGTIQIVCETTEAQQGDEVTVRFDMSNNPGIVALIFRFTYDQNALEFVSYDVGEDCADFIDLA